MGSEQHNDSQLDLALVIRERALHPPSEAEYLELDYIPHLEKLLAQAKTKLDELRNVFKATPH